MLTLKHFDVANLGEWTRMAKGIFPDSVFYMIEPLSEMEDNLNKVCEDFPEQSIFHTEQEAKSRIM
ncbi:MAG: hypothetical protein IPL53_09650 [Ignavibacteria bacterium]|nr:hypothetical protein [Ignavibacteria bacterium]